MPAAGDGVVAGGPSELALGFGSVWTDVPNLTAVVRLDPETGKVAAVIRDGADCCGGVAVVGGSVWVVSGGSVDRIDPKTNEVSARIHLATPDGLDAGLSVLDGALWAAPGNSIVEIDPATGKVISKTAFGRAYFEELAAGNGKLWAWDATTNEIDELRVG